AEIHGCEEQPTRAIEVETLLDHEKLTVIIEDQGGGFDHASYRESISSSAPVSMARSRHKTGGVGGLGIYLMERCADRLEYNDRGNRVTITKMRAAEGASRAT
ncbi:MAG: ATP-binding protein, partial [Planctomycetota bacterium]|nr:ATP-binding protein [Planctomycetota bacterium]